MDMDDIKLGIGLPVIDRNVDRDFFFSFIMMDKPGFTLMAPASDIYAFRESIAAARNSLVAQALTNGCTHLLMMDTDQVHPENTVMQLLSHDADIVGALVCRRYEPFYPILYRGELGSYQYVGDEEVRSGELVEVDATGTGCLLINTDVFEEMDPPWFELKPGENGKPVGEDIRFCSKARAAGRRIYVDTSVKVDHLATSVVNMATHDLYRFSKAHEAIDADKGVPKDSHP